MSRVRQIAKVLTTAGVLGRRTPRRLFPMVAALTPIALTAAVMPLGEPLGLLPAVTLATWLCGPAAGLIAVTLGVAFGPETSTLQRGLFALAGAVDVVVISALLANLRTARDTAAHVAELNANLAASEARFRDLMENAPDAMVIADLAGAIVLLNGAAERMFGYERAELVGQPLDILMPPRFRERHQGQFSGYLADPQPRRMGDARELAALHRSGFEFPIETNLSVLSGAAGPLVCSAIRDVSWRRESERRQALLIRELNHRVKNTLASVQAIIAQTLKTSKSLAAFNTAVMARIAALSHSHDVLTRSDWSGAQVRELVAEQLRPYDDGDGGRFHATGPDLLLSPNRALSLGMALGELATNAAKHGALSSPDGVVVVSWTRRESADGPSVRMLWREVGGPTVRTPRRFGFGSRLIERSVSGGLQGGAQVHYAPDGLRCEIEFPLLPGE